MIDKSQRLKIAIVALIMLVFLLTYFDGRFQRATEFHWGISFSPERSRELGFDPLEVYANMLADLKPKQIRLAANWNEIEPQQGHFNFKDIDQMLRLADEHQVAVILVLGKKAPRWPECHQPDWVNNLSADEQDQASVDMIRQAVVHFKTTPTIAMWQLENEPLFTFGEDCPKLSRSFVKQEMALVRSLDPRPILVTDSGELGRWLPTATLGADYFGTTMYRVVHSKYTGYFKYPLPPAFFRVKAGILETFVHPKKIIGVELQAEPWVQNGILNTDLNTQRTLMNPKIFASNVEYAQAVGFSDNYLWGVEWWYWMAKKQGDWGMWAAAKDLIVNDQP